MPRVSAALLARIAGVGAHVIGERITRPMPRALDVVPRSAEALTHEWLTAALCRDHPGAAVVDVRTGEGSHGSTSRQPITVTYNETGRLAGLPTSVFTKTTPNFKSRLVSVVPGATPREVRFYRDVESHLTDIETPHAYYADVDERSGRSVILLEDVSGRVAEFGDPAKVRMTRVRAESLVTLLARLHGAHWRSARFGAGGDLATLMTSQQQHDFYDATVDFPSRTLVGADRAAAFAPAEFTRRRADIWPALKRAMELNVQGDQTLLHHDVHLGNWYVTKDDEMGLLDFQCIARGGWSNDFAYAVMSALDVEDRRAWEKELLELYLERLGEAGGQPPTFDAAWLLYRQQVFHGLVFWLYTIGYGRFQPEMQPRDICEANVGRMTQAVVDLRSFDALDEH